jgi:lysozyme family protein
MARAKPPYGEYWHLAAVRWDELAILSRQRALVNATARKLVALKPRYLPIEEKTGVPWYVIAVLHERESGANFSRQLAQGDPLDRQSIHRPISGPFNTFEESAVWALDHDHFNKVIDWRLEKILYFCEAWNGWGYWMYHYPTPSPYVWGATNIQEVGKYIADGVWSSTEWDTQLGCAALLYQMSSFDKSIKFVRETPEGTPGDAAPPIPPPTPRGANKPVTPEPSAWSRFFKVVFDWLKS